MKKEKIELTEDEIIDTVTTLRLALKTEDLTDKMRKRVEKAHNAICAQVGMKPFKF